jgi:hypothetical protein
VIGIKMARSSCFLPIAAKKVGDPGVLVMRIRRNMNEQVQNGSVSYENKKKYERTGAEREC